MLIDITNILEDAKKNKYGVAAPTIWDERSIRVTLQAAEELKSPIILDFVKDYGINEIFENGIAFEMADKVKIPVAVQLDHGETFEDNMWALRAGFQAITIERAGMSFDKLKEEVKDIVRIAHSVKVAVESEVGHVPDLGIQGEEVAFTDPEQARDFVSDSRVDIISVSIGNLHGTYFEKPIFDFERIKRLSEIVPAF